MVHRHIREAPRDDEREDCAAGELLNSLDGWQPPCSRDPIAFAPDGYTITHYDPIDGRNLPAVQEEIPPYSFCPSPYRWMREENFRQLCEDENLNIRGPEDIKKTKGWVYEPERQIALLNAFWGKLERESSLVFFYCNHGNPIDDQIGRLLVGVGRISDIHPQMYFGEVDVVRPEEQPVWSRCITHDFENQGFRLPYQEYLNGGHDPSGILCPVPEGAKSSFSFVSEHVTDDVAVGVLERLLQSLQAVKDEGKVAGDWENHLTWLNDVLGEVWTNRGPFPGIGSVLEFLGCTSGTAFHRQVLAPRFRAGENAWEYVHSVLNGETKCEEPRYENGLTQAAGRWSSYQPVRRELLEFLTRFELTPQQVKRVANTNLRAKAGIDATDEQIIANPYLLSEMDQGGADSEAITLEAIDRGMRPEGEAAHFIKADAICAQDDPRRVRATAASVLNLAAVQGDTLLPFNETLNRIEERFPERRTCTPDPDLVAGQAAFYQELLDYQVEDEHPTFAIKNLADVEAEVRSRLKRLVKRTNDPPRKGWDWKSLLQQEFGEGGTDLPAEVEERAQAEKALALATLYERRFSILTGRAGTGKTSVLKVFLKGLEELHGKRPLLLLAPTGKARVRLMDRTKREDGSVRDAYTIHQFLMRHDWLNPETFSLRFQGGNQRGTPTVIIDEASMIPMDLFGVLFRALDLNKVSRLILVGDPNQLPPIGPGRPFVDIIAWLEQSEDRQQCLAKLTERARHEDHNSLALQLADGYLREDPSPDDDALLSRAARQDVGGDLEVHFWNDNRQMEQILGARMKVLLGVDDTSDAYASLNKSLGVADTNRPEPTHAEHWQILSPVRNHEFGTIELNRKVQQKFRGGLLARKGYAKPFGEERIVWTDKVMQTFNRGMKGWPHNTGIDYVANGEIGLVTYTHQKYLDVKYSTQPDVSYRYFRSDVDANLELAYALTVHKSQGSDFDIVFFILPATAATLSRELLYTGLTRFRKKIVLLIERDTKVLETLRNPQASDTLLRNTNLFVKAVRPEGVESYLPSHLIHRTSSGILVRSKSEVIVADTLTRLGISYEYEQKLTSKDDPNDFRLPDFTVSFEGDTFYWEHLGMLSVPSYREQWDRKRQWYEDNRYLDRLITSEDGSDGSINAAEIEQTARKQILLEDE
ncbi:AAA family ATPase [Rubinisphaera brasiliensis]|nr:AAA family ATPase [Rubinisphaera brasiliensis]